MQSSTPSASFLIRLCQRAPFTTELWDEIGYSETERLTFRPMLVTEEGFTDELLQQHTQEAEKLRTKFETMKHILEVKE